MDWLKQNGLGLFIGFCSMVGVYVTLTNDLTKMQEQLNSRTMYIERSDNHNERINDLEKADITFKAKQDEGMKYWVAFEGLLKEMNVTMSEVKKEISESRYERRTIQEDIKELKEDVDKLKGV